VEVVDAIGCGAPVGSIEMAPDLNVVVVIVAPFELRTTCAPGVPQPDCSMAVATNTVNVDRPLIVAVVPKTSGVKIDAPLARSTANRKKMAVVADTRGRVAVTRYRAERRFGAGVGVAALVECRLLTGRTHQIRVHLAHIGHPLIGDPAYGTRAGRAQVRVGPHAGEVAAAIAGFARQALHARLLGFTHPATGEELTFESPLPTDMAGLLSNLERL